ncbi:hypothetical protein ACFS07_17765 [Undibacterium arcticum]
MMTRLHVNLGATVLALVSLNVCAATAPDTANTELIKRGQYLATAGDCIACHSTPGGKPMAGGLSLPTPLGPIVSTNITPSKTHGIGNYTQAQFNDALRKGVRVDGQHLYPAMPYYVVRDSHGRRCAGAVRLFHACSCAGRCDSSCHGSAISFQHPAFDGGLESAISRQ